MLQDGPSLVLLDPLGHHVQDIVHHSRTQFQVKVRFHALLSDRLGYTLGVTTWRREGKKKEDGPGGWNICTLTSNYAGLLELTTAWKNTTEANHKDSKQCSL